MSSAGATIACKDAISQSGICLLGCAKRSQNVLLILLSSLTYAYQLQSRGRQVTAGMSGCYSAGALPVELWAHVLQHVAQPEYSSPSLIKPRQLAKLVQAWSPT